jgi:hypothetical protein
MVVAVLVVMVRRDNDQQRFYHHAPTAKPEAANAVVALDDARGSARNTLSHTSTSSNKLVKLLHLVG